MPSGVYKRPLRLCSVENCNRKHYANGLCKKHHGKQWRENNRDRCIGYTRINTIKRRKKYNSDREENLKVNIRVSKFKTQKYRENKEYREKYVLRRDKDRLKQQIISKRTYMGYRRWTMAEIDYLKQNNKKKTQLEMAIELNRTYYSISMALSNFGIERKTRIIKGRYYKLINKPKLKEGK